MFVLDTNVVSELRRAKAGKADKNVMAWAARVPAVGLFLSAITILELEIGVLLDSGTRCESLTFGTRRVTNGSVSIRAPLPVWPIK